MPYEMTEWIENTRETLEKHRLEKILNDSAIKLLQEYTEDEETREKLDRKRGKLGMFLRRSVFDTLFPKATKKFRKKKRNTKEELYPYTFPKTEEEKHTFTDSLAQITDNLAEVITVPQHVWAPENTGAHTGALYSPHDVLLPEETEEARKKEEDWLQQVFSTEKPSGQSVHQIGIDLGNSYQSIASSPLEADDTLPPVCVPEVDESGAFSPIKPSHFMAAESISNVMPKKKRKPRTEKTNPVLASPVVQGLHDLSSLEKYYKTYWRKLNTPLEDNFPGALKQFIKLRGSTQEKLSQAINMSERNFRRYVSGELEPELRTVVAICIELKLDPTDCDKLIHLAGYSLTGKKLHRAYHVLLGLTIAITIEDANEFLINSKLEPLTAVA